MLTVITRRRKLSVQELTIQSDCYKLLAACFYEPEKKLFIDEQVCENLARLLTEVAPEAEPAAQKMQVALSKLDDKELLIDYARLFVGPFELLAPSYGSIYLEGKSQIMGDSTMAVLKHYKEAGLSVDIKEPPDHIAFELEFLHYISALEAEAFEKHEHDQQLNFAMVKKEFLEKFLAPWVPLFCEKIRGGTTNSFYNNLADCLQITVEQFASDLQLSPTQPRGDRAEDACRASA